MQLFASYWSDQFLLPYSYSVTVDRGIIEKPNANIDTPEMATLTEIIAVHWSDTPCICWNELNFAAL
jgi:hypothetical protein